MNRDPNRLTMTVTKMSEHYARDCPTCTNCKERGHYKGQCTFQRREVANEESPAIAYPTIEPPPLEKAMGELHMNVPAGVPTGLVIEVQAEFAERAHKHESEIAKIAAYLEAVPVRSSSKIKRDKEESRPVPEVKSAKVRSQ